MSESLREMAHKISSKLEIKNPLNDSQHLILARTISMIVNEAFFMLEEGIAEEKDIDLAMKLGTNFPKGPLELAESYGEIFDRRISSSNAPCLRRHL